MSRRTMPVLPVVFVTYRANATDIERGKWKARIREPD